MRAGAVATAALLTLGCLAGCSSSPPTSSKLIAARSAVAKAQSYGDFTGTARTNLDAARHYLERAEDGSREGVSAREVENLAYASEQLATAAIARYDSLRLQDRQAQEREAKMAQHRAETAELEAERARQIADAVK